MRHGWWLNCSVLVHHHLWQSTLADIVDICGALFLDHKCWLYVICTARLMNTWHIVVRLQVSLFQLFVPRWLSLFHDNDWLLGPHWLRNADVEGAWGSGIHCICLNRRNSLLYWDVLSVANLVRWVRQLQFQRFRLTLVQLDFAFSFLLRDATIWNLSCAILGALIGTSLLSILLVAKDWL